MRAQVEMVLIFSLILITLIAIFFFFSGNENKKMGIEERKTIIDSVKRILRDELINSIKYIYKKPFNKTYLYKGTEMSLMYSCGNIYSNEDILEKVRSTFKKKVVDRFKNGMFFFGRYIHFDTNSMEVYFFLKNGQIEVEVKLPTSMDGKDINNIYRINVRTDFKRVYKTLSMFDKLLRNNFFEKTVYKYFYLGRGFFENLFPGIRYECLNDRKGDVLKYVVLGMNKEVNTIFDTPLSISILDGNFSVEGYKTLNMFDNLCVEISPINLSFSMKILIAIHDLILKTSLISVANIGGINNRIGCGELKEIKTCYGNCYAKIVVVDPDGYVDNASVFFGNCYLGLTKNGFVESKIPCYISQLRVYSNGRFYVDYYHPDSLKNIVVFLDDIRNVSFNVRFVKMIDNRFVEDKNNNYLLFFEVFGKRSISIVEKDRFFTLQLPISNYTAILYVFDVNGNLVGFAHGDFNSIKDVFITVPILYNVGIEELFNSGEILKKCGVKMFDERFGDIKC